jgi:hypothetical protein
VGSAARGSCTHPVRVAVGRDREEHRALARIEVEVDAREEESVVLPVVLDLWVENDVVDEEVPAGVVVADERRDVREPLVERDLAGPLARRLVDDRPPAVDRLDVLVRPGAELGIRGDDTPDVDGPETVVLGGDFDGVSSDGRLGAVRPIGRRLRAGIGLSARYLLRGALSGPDVAVAGISLTERLGLDGFALVHSSERPVRDVRGRHRGRTQQRHDGDARTGVLQEPAAARTVGPAERARAPIVRTGVLVGHRYDIIVERS